MNPYKVVEQFEEEIAKYAGSKYACAVDSCTNALLLCLDYYKYFTGELEDITIPKRTYVSVPQVIRRLGGEVKFKDIKWKGRYQLTPYEIWDCARHLTSNMHRSNQYECLSLHWAKTLNLGQGGVILHDDPEAQEWFKRARFDGRTQGVKPKDDKFDMLGWHFMMSPRDAADALTRLYFLPKDNKPLPNDDYSDLSKVNWNDLR